MHVHRDHDWIRRYSPREADAVTQTLLDQIGGWPAGPGRSAALDHIAATVRQKPGDQPGRWSMPDFLGRLQNLSDLIETAWSPKSHPRPETSPEAVGAALRVLLAPAAHDPVIDALDQVVTATPAFGTTRRLTAATWAAAVEQASTPTRQAHTAALAAITADPRVVPPGPITGP